ncbi:MAG: rhodanese-like domain-containing protein [Pseudomonadota bacterium]|nr:rhodanese-like domain-containing protein [Pseudomonadota bacterium]MDE3038664.1 rhodanese-like domain-containing protein [Pseudomonadota bacterium]
MAIQNVKPEVLSRWLDDGGAALIDVREPSEHKAASIPGAHLLPLGNVTSTVLPDHAGKKLVVHCQSGGRSAQAAEKLLKENPNLEIHNLEGGIGAWKEAGYKVNGAGGFLPLDRQVQLTVGLCVLIGSLLAYYVSPAFLLFTGFFGLGLTFAGITGHCGLAMLMAKMPWNKAGC